MGRIRVAVIFGGRSSEHGISVVSAAGVIGAIDPDKYEVVPIGITRSGSWLLTEADPERMRIADRRVPEVTDGRAVVQPADPTNAGLLALPDAAPDAAGAAALDAGAIGDVDVILPMLHGRFGEDGTIQGLLEMAGVPYVGSGVFGSAAAMDKEFAKKLLRAEGLDVGEFVVVRAGESVGAADVAHLGLPVFVKPARAGSSVGISKVRSWGELTEAIETAREHDEKVLIEAAVVGHEVECGVLEDEHGRPQASVPAEIRMVRGHDWYDFEAKYLDDACEFDIPAKLSEAQTRAVQEASCRAFTALDCAGLARVDFFVTDDGPIVNEVNTMPGFTPISLFPQVWAASGVDYPTLVDRLIQSALRRGPR